MINNIQKIGIGTVQFGTHYGISNEFGKTPAGEVSRILASARDNHVTLIDTASAYGDAESVLGRHDIEEFQVVSKFLPVKVNGSIVNQCEDSLGRLGISNLYGYLAHRSLELLHEEESWQQLLKVKTLNLAKKVGFSLYHPEDLDLLLKFKFYPDIIQVPYSYFDRRFEKHMINLQKNGCEIHVRSVFLQGLFFLDPASLSNYFNEVKPYILNLRNTVNHLPASLLNFVIEKPFVDKVIVGVENHRQFIQNITGLHLNSALPELHTEISESILNPSKWPDAL